MDYIQNLIEILRSTMTLLYFEVRSDKEYTNEGFKEAITELVDNVIGGNNGQPEEGENKPEQGEAV